MASWLDSGWLDLPNTDISPPIPGLVREQNELEAASHLCRPVEQTAVPS
jgi:hypothetical protein